MSTIRHWIIEFSICDNSIGLAPGKQKATFHVCTSDEGIAELIAKDAALKKKLNAEPPYNDFVHTDCATDLCYKLFQELYGVPNSQPYSRDKIRETVTAPPKDAKIYDSRTASGIPDLVVDLLTPIGKSE